MSRVYSEADYLGVVDDSYRRYDFFTTRGDRINGSLNQFKNNTVWVAGCGWGYLVDELLDFGFNDVHGFDASTYAVNTKAPEELTAERAARIHLADVLSSTDMRTMRQATGIPRGIITEDMLPCMADANEVATALANLRGELHPQGQMAHIISVWPEGEQGYSQRDPDGAIRYITTGDELRMPGFLWLTLAEWRALIGPDDPIVTTGDYQVHT